MSQNSTETGGAQLSSLLLVAFIVLKLTHYIDWSWWWVLSPIWIPIALVVAIWLLYGIIKAFGFIR